MTGPLGDMGSLLRQAQLMQRELDRLREDLRQARLTGSAGGGVVSIVIGGDRQVHSVHIDPSVLRSADSAAVEDLVLAAMRDAIGKADQLSEQTMSRLTGGLQLPGFS